MLYGFHGGHFLGRLLLFGLIVLVPSWRICRKAAYSGWLSLLLLVPFANIGLLYFLAFVDWPKRTASVAASKPQEPQASASEELQPTRSR